MPRARRAALLAAVPAFAGLDAAALDRLAGVLGEARFPPGGAVIAQGDPGDRLYVLVEGRAEVTLAATPQPLPLATLGPGEMAGEVALMTPGAVRAAGVTALTPLLVLTLTAADFLALLDANPMLRARFASLAEQIVVGNFLKAATPFAALPPSALRRLAERLREVSLAAGEMLLREGEPGDACYLLRAGRLEVTASGEAGADRRLTTLYPGSLVGEAALLTGAPRNATVRALEDSRLLALRRDDLLAALGADRAVGGAVLGLLATRDRPRRVPGVEVHHRALADGTQLAILKEPRRGAYFRLSVEGLFLWERLDGRHTMRDLALDYLERFKAFAPAQIAEVVAGLRSAGFLEGQAPSREVARLAARLTALQRILLLSRRILEWQVALPGMDCRLDRLYRGGVRLLYTRTALIALALLALFGGLAFLRAAPRASAALHGTGGGALLLLLLPAYALSVVLHEAGHAFTVKRFGFEVPRVGVGWYWFGPIAYVDTSDMWLAGRWPRVAVAAAGPCTNLVLAGAAGLVALLAGNALAIAAAWQFALTSYLLVLINLNPLLEYDGYYLLMDWLDRPNLRRQIMAWLGRDFLPALRASGGLRGHRLELLYGTGSLLYVAFAAVQAALLYRLIAEHWVAGHLPGWVAAALAWIVALAIVALSAARLAGDLRGVREHG